MPKVVQGGVTCIHASVGQSTGVIVGYLYQVRRQRPQVLWQCFAQLMQRYLYSP